MSSHESILCPACGGPLYKGPGPPWGPRVFCNSADCPDARGKPLPPDMLPRRARRADVDRAK